MRGAKTTWGQPFHLCLHAPHSLFMNSGRLGTNLCLGYHLLEICKFTISRVLYMKHNPIQTLPIFKGH